MNKRIQIEEIIYFACENWDINPLSRKFAYELSLEIMRLLEPDKPKDESIIVSEETVKEMFK